MIVLDEPCPISTETPGTLKPHVMSAIVSDYCVFEIVGFDMLTDLNEKVSHVLERHLPLLHRRLVEPFPRRSLEADLHLGGRIRKHKNTREKRVHLRDTQHP